MAMAPYKEINELIQRMELAKETLGKDIENFDIKELQRLNKLANELANISFQSIRRAIHSSKQFRK